MPSPGIYPEPMSACWEKIQNNLEKSLKPGIFQVWIKPLQGELLDNTLFLTAPNEFVASWVRERLQDTIREMAANELGVDPEICIQGTNGHSKSRYSPLMQATGQQSLALPLEYSSRGADQVQTWRFRFEDFVVGSCNQLAYAACTSVCQRDFPADNIFLSSAPGLGKTHLMQSIGNHICSQKKDGRARIAYLLSEQFGNQMVQALKSREIEKFKSRYRDNVDLLLLEDIHFFQGKAKMQEELLSVVKSLLENGNKVVFTSSFLPKELDKVDSQLTSYFCSGLLTPIQKPDFDLRLRLVEKKASGYHLKIPSKLTELIASTITADIRQLESCIQNLALKSRLLQQEITSALVREVLQNYNRGQEVPDLNQIIQFVCEVFELPLAKLRSQSRKRQVVMARNTAFYLARKYTDLSLKDIGQHFNRRHSTVLKGITCLEREMQRNSTAGRQLLRIMEKLEQ